MTKNKKEIAVAGLTAVVAAVAGAQAASAADPMPVEEAAFDWSGAYAGVAAGMMFGGDSPHTTSSEADYDVENDFIFGGFVGVNYQYQSGIVVGGEVALQSGFDADGEDESNDYGVDYMIDGKLKLGLAMDEFLIYAFAGPSFVAVTRENDSYSDDYGSGGINYGIGADWMVWDNVSIGAEVLGRTVIDPYTYSSENGKNSTHWQGMLRAAFHF